MTYNRTEDKQGEDIESNIADDEDEDKDDEEDRTAHKRDEKADNKG